MRAANHSNIFVPPSVLKSRILNRLKTRYEENGNFEVTVERTVCDRKEERSREEEDSIKLRSYQVSSFIF